MKRIDPRRLLLALLLPGTLLCVACAYFDFTQNTRDYESVNDTLPILDNQPPHVSQVQGETFSGARLTCHLRATDEEGDPVLFLLERQPEKGQAVISGNTLVYTPDDKARGKDSFSYQAMDCLGNLSQPATITVDIEKYKGVSYSDLDDDPNQIAILKLTQEGLLDGRQVGQSVLFEPEQTLSRNEFVALAVGAAQLKLPKKGETCFLDDDDIPTWARPYVLAAESAGAIEGYPAADGTAVWQGENDITAAEAAVIVQRLSDEAQTSVTFSQSDALSQSGVPVWAAGAMAFLEEVPTIQPLLPGEPISRSAAAGLCWRALAA